MNFKLRYVTQAIFYIALVAYPGLVFYLLVINNVWHRQLPGNCLRLGFIIVANNCNINAVHSLNGFNMTLGNSPAAN